MTEVSLHDALWVQHVLLAFAFTRQMFERLVTLALAGGGVFVLTMTLLLPLVASAQMLVRPMPSDQQPPSPLADGSEADTSAQEIAPRTNPQGIGAGSIDDEQGERLIQEYRRQAGPVSPSKIFSALKVDPHVSVGVVYDDNILVSTGGNKLSDVITTLAGGVTISLGDFISRTDSFLVFNYTASGEIFARHGGEDALNHDASLIARYRPHAMMAQFTSTFELTHDATADLGQRVSQKLFGDGLLLRYFRNERTTIEGAVDFSYYDYAGISSNTQVSGGLALDYLVADKVTLGLGAVFGRLTASDSLEEYFEQLQARVGYSVTHKITLSLRVGLEVRERGSQAGTAVDPVFSLAGTWTPYGGTALTLEGHRRTEASAAIGGADYISTGIQFGVKQHLVQRFYAQFDVGYENADYENVTLSQSTSRSDNYFTVRGSVGYDFVEWVKLEAYYLYRNDHSTQSIYSFASNRFGLQANLVY